MDEIKKLFQVKRIFAMILAAAMVITMMPTTANAASISDNAAAQTQEANETSADAATPDTDGSVADESLQLDAVGETVWGFVDNRTESEKTAVYSTDPGDAGNPGNPQHFSSGLKNIVITKDGSEYTTLYNDYECTQEWQKKTGTGNEDYTALGVGEYPIDAGEYRLAVTAPDGTTKRDFIFTITAYEPEVAVELGEIEAGTANKDVKPESFISSLYFHNGQRDYDSGHYDDNWNLVYDYEKIYFTTTLDGYVSGRETPIPGTILVSVAQIKDAITGKVLEDTAVLTKDQDYVVDLTFTFKEEAAKIYGTNYKLPGTVSKLVTIGDLITPTVVVDLGEKEQLGADGKPVMEPVTELERTYTGEAVTEPDQTKEYTVKIQLNEQETDKDGNPVTDTDGNPVYKTIPVTAENLTTSWYEGYNEYSDSNIVDDNKLEGAPVEAGDYTYLLTYEGQQGIYAKATAKIHVLVNAAELTIVPKFTEGAKFYPGMTVKQALAQVDYTVLDAEKKSFDANVDRNSFWGVYNTSSYTTLPFEPVFGIQVKEGTEEKLNDDGTSAGTVDIYGDGTGRGYGYLSAGTTLQAGQNYRVVFTGQKAVYYGDGTETQKRGINSAGNSFNPSYYVADGTNGDKTNEENAAAITLEAGTEAEINSNLVKDGKGSSYENPISKVYDGTGFFNKKAEYKIATVNAGNKMVAEKTNPAITYTWERQEGTDQVLDNDGNVVTDNDGNPVEVPVWVDYDYNDVSLSNLVSPVNAGKYRLTISYADGRNDKDNRGGYYAQPVEVFYEIQPQNAIIVPDAPEGGYSAHIGYTASQFLNSLYSSENLDLAGELPHKVYKLDENLRYNPEEPLNLLSGIVNVTTGEGEYWYPYYVEWCVAKQNEQGTWVRLNDSDVLESGGVYELIADYWYFDFDSYANNYRTYMDAGKDEDGNQLVIYFTNGVPIKLTTQGTAALNIELDTSKITAKTTKEYDGTPIGILEEVKKNLVVYKQDDANKTPVTDVLNDIQFVWSNNDNGKRVTETEPVDAGTYTLYAKFTGNASYKAFDSSNFCLNTGLTVTITPRELTVVPSLKEPIVAGNSNPSQYYDWSKTEFRNVAESDKEAFTYSNTSGFAAVSSRRFRVCDVNGQYVSKLKGNTEYTFEFTSMSLRGNYANNYVLKYEKVPFTTVRGYSSVEGIDNDQIKPYDLKDSLADVKGIGTHTITANEGIEYVYGVDNNETGEGEDGNFIALRITMPEEYNSFSEAEVVYANSIEKAGGRILNKSDIENYSRYYNYIDVRFNAEDGKEKPIEFDIRWEEGYVEHFILDFSKAELLEDLRNAVAPKSISLVSPSKKMVVGGTQWLDVKLTTAQIGDLIHLTYTVDKPDVLCVTESGYVTALAAGDATITIEATRRGENGEYVSTTPAKKTTLKVKVSEVSAPKIKKVDNILDGQARIWWTPLDENDGYRREIYVLEGKTNYTKQDFENKIASMKNGNWEDIFAVAPVYENTYSNTYYDSKTKLSYDYVSGLKPDTEYTVYVRNVNQVRTLTECGHDNCKVAESHDGSVKGFKTTKGQVKGLSVGFDEELRYVGFDEGENLYYYNMIALSQGTTSVTVSGYFSEWVNAAGDYDWKTLPLSKDDQKDYVNPKLVYMVGELEILDSRDWEKDGYIGYRYGSYYDEDGDSQYGYRYYYLNKTTKASIDKKGKLKLNGVGEVNVVVQDSTTGCWNYNTIEITATADSIANKNVKMQVGQKIWLGDLLTYKEGNKVLTGDYARKIIVDDTLREAISKSGCFELSTDERYLIAVKAGKLSLTLKDTYVGEDKTATVNLTATALEPAKNLKAAAITDQSFEVEFAHSLNPDEVGYKDNLLYAEGLGFRIKVTDARGTLLRSVYVKAENCNYDPVTKKYNFKITGLTKKSKYNVSVTAEFGTETSKEAKKAITTTLLPASYIALDKDAMNAGVSVYVHGNDATINQSYFCTGNSYTLEVGGIYFNPGAKAAMTDTLTWTSSNSKVATIKANTGSYSAALKATGQGSTIIELKSKVTKAVIARYKIYVSVVGNAYVYPYPQSRNFFGEDEYLDSNAIMSYALKNGIEPLHK